MSVSILYRPPIALGFFASIYASCGSHPCLSLSSVATLFEQVLTSPLALPAVPPLPSPPPRTAALSTGLWPSRSLF